MISNTNIALIIVGVIVLGILIFFLSLVRLILRSSKDSQTPVASDEATGGRFKSVASRFKKALGNLTPKGETVKWIIGGIVIIAIVAIICFRPHSSSSTSNKKKHFKKGEVVRELHPTHCLPSSVTSVPIDNNCIAELDLPTGDNKVYLTNTRNSKRYNDSGLHDDKADTVFIHNNHDYAINITGRMIQN